MAECDDKNCPVHGDLKVRGARINGVVVSTKPKKTAIIEREYLRYVPKYDRYERRKTRISVHLPPCITVKVGDKVQVGECRKVSKTKSFVVLELLKKV